MRKFPYAERHSDLGVVGLRRADDAIVVLEELVEPFLDDGLAVGAGNTDDGTLELPAHISCQVLQGLYGIAGNEGLYALLTKFGYILGAVVAVGSDSEEKHFIHSPVAMCF